jgi:hypothetical protein
MKKRIGLLLAITIAATLPMAHGGTFVVKDGAAATKYMKTEGTGTSGDPYVPHHAVSDGTDIAGVDTAGADAGSNTSNRLAGSSWLHGYNGTTWDRIRAGLTGTTTTPTGFLNTLPFGRYNATPPTLTDGQWTSLQFDSSGALKVNPGTVAVTGTFWQATQPVSAASLPLPTGAATSAKQDTGNTSLASIDSKITAVNTGAVTVASSALPTGAATAAKQPALGTAGTASPDVLSVQGIASMTPITTTISGTPSVSISGTPSVSISNSPTVTANIGTSGSLALDATLTGGSAKSVVRGGAKGSTSAADVTSTASGANHQPLDVAIYDGSGNHITSFGGGTQYADGATQATPTGTVALGKNGSDVLKALSLDGSGYLNVNVAAGGGSGGTSSSYGGAFPATGTAGGFTDGTNMQGARVYDTDTGAGSQYSLGVSLRKAASGGSVELGTSTDPVRTDPTGTTAQPVTDNGGSLTVDGTVAATQSGSWSVTATQATAANLNMTEANSGSIKTAVELIDDVVATDGAAAPTKGAMMAGTDGTNAQTIKTDASGEIQVDVLTMPNVTIGAALPAGTNAIGKLAANDGVDIGDVTITNASIPVTDNGGSLTVDGTVTASNTAGDVAHDSADSGNPVKIGAVAKSADPTAVANGDRANLYTDLNGKLIVMPYTLPENQIYGSNASAITDTTSTSIIAAAGAGIRNYITSILVTNSHATVGTLVKITDGSGGTLLAQGYAAPAGGGWSLALPVPIKTTANTALHAICGTTGANVYVTAVGYKAP